MSGQEKRAPKKKALLVLEDGTSFQGWSCGIDGTKTGEICFNTSMTGYQEVISDPSYAGQIIVMTYPHIGNYGTNKADMQSRGLFLEGLVVRDLNNNPSNFRNEKSLSDLLIEQNIVAIEGIDTRKLTKHIRTNGAMRAIIKTIDSEKYAESSKNSSTDGESYDVNSQKLPDSLIEELLEEVRGSQTLLGKNLASVVSTNESYEFTEIDTPLSFAKESYPEPKFKVVAIDCGIKTGILRGLRFAGCEVEIVPWDASAEEILAKKPDGVFVSNGPGDPQPVDITIETIKQLIGKIPIFGICLGNQMIGIAAGAEIEKLKFGHHGVNQPVMNLLSNCVEITAQNHGFGILFPSLGELIPDLSGGYTEHFDDLRNWSEMKIAPVVNNTRVGRIQLTHVNLNDGTAEGMAFLDNPVFSVQYHPEASSGPNDPSYLFESFVRLMENRPDFLDISLRDDRMYGYHV